MRGRFTTWGIGAGCVVLFGASSFVLAAPERADHIIFHSTPDTVPEWKEPEVQRAERIPVSRPDLAGGGCAVVSWDGYRAKALDGSDVWLGAGTTLALAVSVRGRRANAAVVQNGEHAGKVVEYATLGGTRQTLWPCDLETEAKIGGLLDDADPITADVMYRAAHVEPFVERRYPGQVQWDAQQGLALGGVSWLLLAKYRLDERAREIERWEGWFDDPEHGRHENYEPPPSSDLTWW